MTSNTWEYDIHELNKMMIHMAHILVSISALYSSGFCSLHYSCHILAFYGIY
jgi:hypothetical protein